MYSDDYFRLRELRFQLVIGHT